MDIHQAFRIINLRLARPLVRCIDALTLYRCVNLTEVATRSRACEERSSADRIGNLPPLSRQEVNQPRIDDRIRDFHRPQSRGGHFLE
jgi:hypothetical protein